mmetsp:Transcript_28620/g.67663  ORF Transcript_28620/g.67663 Transcript_28620/m.67663 type:complete len:232 (+) Transcript_28620:249-944(+)
MRHPSVRGRLFRKLPRSCWPTLAWSNSHIRTTTLSVRATRNRNSTRQLPPPPRPLLFPNDLHLPSWTVSPRPPSALASLSTAPLDNGQSMTRHRNTHHHNRHHTIPSHPHPSQPHHLSQPPWWWFPPRSPHPLSRLSPPICPPRRNRGWSTSTLCKRTRPRCLSSPDTRWPHRPSDPPHSNAPPRHRPSPAPRRCSSQHRPSRDHHRKRHLLMPSDARPNSSFSAVLSCCK